MKVKCKSCNRNVEVKILKTWSKINQDGDAYDEFAKVSLLKHKRGIFLTQVCRSTNQRFTISLGSHRAY